MITNSKKINLDKIGMTTSILCAIHCLALPFLLTAGLISGLSWLNHHAVEWGLIIFAIIVAGMSFSNSYWYNHQSILPIFVAAVGCILLLSSRMIEGDLEHTITALGGLILAGAHYINWIKSKPAVS